MSLSTPRTVIIVIAGLSAAALWVGRVGIGGKPPEWTFLVATLAALAFLVLAPAQGLSKPVVGSLSVSLAVTLVVRLLHLDKSTSPASSDALGAALSVGVTFVIAALVRFRFVASACLVILIVLGVAYRSATVVTVWAWIATLAMLLVYSHALFRDPSGSGRYPGGSGRGVGGYPPKGARGTPQPGRTPGGSQPPGNGKPSDADPLQGTLGIDISPAVGQGVVRRMGIILLLIQLITIIVFVISHIRMLGDIVHRYWPYFTAVSMAFFVWVLVLWSVWRFTFAGSRARLPISEREL
jgi:hypothetical protein